MPHEELRPYSLQDWHALDDASMSRMQQARNALALVQDLAVGQKRTTPPTIEVHQDELGDFLSLIVEQLDTVAGESQPMRPFLKDHAAEVRLEVAS